MEQKKNKYIMSSRYVLFSAEGKDDIKYNFLIGQDGVIYEGRGWGVVGQHTNGQNLMSVGQSLTYLFFRGSFRLFSIWTYFV